MHRIIKIVTCIVSFISLTAHASSLSESLDGKTMYITGAVVYLHHDQKPTHFALYSQHGPAAYLRPNSEQQANLMQHAQEELGTYPVFEFYGTWRYDGYNMIFEIDTLEQVPGNPGPAGVYLITGIGKYPGDGSIAGHLSTMELVRRKFEGNQLSRVYFVNPPGSSAYGLTAVVTSLYSLHKMRLIASSLGLSSPVKVERLNLGLESATKLSLR